MSELETVSKQTPPFPTLPRRNVRMLKPDAVDRYGDEPSTHPSLIARAKAGHADGWTMLVQVYGPVVYRWMRRCGVQSADAADIMQETFLSVISAISRLETTGADTSFRGWLWTIARNKLRDRQRRTLAADVVDGSEAGRLLETHVCNQHDDADPPSTTEEDAALAKSQTLAILRSSFDPRSWRMFWETAVVGRTVADVAVEMNVSNWAVYKAKSRVLQRLRRELSE